jgi:putative oxidoreductase
MRKHISELLSRIVIGTVFIESGVGKLQNLPNVVSYFESLQIPFATIQAPMVSGLELVCGLFVLFGFFTKLSSLPLIGIMTVALITAKAEDISSFSDLLGLSEFLYIVILVWLATLGAQAVSIDQWRCRRSGGSCQVKPAK